MLMKNIDQFSKSLQGTPEGFTLHDNGGEIYVTDSDGGKLNVFPIPIEEERAMKSNSSECAIKISLVSGGVCSEPISFKSSSIFDIKRYVEVFGATTFAEFDEEMWNTFFRVLKVALSSTPQCEVYTYNGWNRELDAYLFGNIRVTAHECTDVKSTAVRNKIDILRDKSPSDVCSAVDGIVRDLFDDQFVGYTLLMFCVMSYLKQACVNRYGSGPSFLLGIVGESGSYKTSLAMALFNSANVVSCSFEDTRPAIQRTLKANLSGTIVIDDYKCRNTSNDSKYERLIRIAGDVYTNAKIVDESKVSDTPVTSMPIITGEVRPRLQQSSYSRVLFVDLGDNPVNREALSALQSSREKLNTFIVLFLQFLMSEGDVYRDLLSDVEQIRDAAIRDSGASSMHGRYYDMYAWNLVVWKLYVSFMGHNNLKVEFPFGDNMLEFVRRQSDYYDSDPVKMFASAYAAMYAKNEVTVKQCRTPKDLNFDVLDFDDKLFVRSKLVYMKICSYYERQGLNFPISEAKLRKMLKEKGLLYERCAGKTTCERKTVDNASYSGFYVFKNLFLKYGGTDDE